MLTYDLRQTCLREFEVLLWMGEYQEGEVANDGNGSMPERVQHGIRPGTVTSTTGFGIVKVSTVSNVSKISKIAVQSITQHTNDSIE